ncbi:hypothetical protein GBAR_LOCUS27931 [Geodia barretti]|uniref:Uncharacterized protein n=1 Tax=Geodia barretti TaxID=519541 RepID=A0AA35TNJ8_GEOBA|nr:hypothetical protein GBAR_LOCUS27931 [Geodia barretti]
MTIVTDTEPCRLLIISASLWRCTSVEWQGSVWLHLWSSVHGRSLHVPCPQPDEQSGGVCQLRGERPRLLPPPHGPPLLHIHRHLSPGDHWDRSLTPHHRLVQLLSLQTVCHCSGHGLTTAPHCLPLRPALRRFCIAHSFLNACFSLHDHGEW